MTRTARAAFERTALISAALPLLFAVYLARSPHTARARRCCSGSCCSSIAGLLAIAIARREELLHGAGALATLADDGRVARRSSYLRVDAGLSSSRRGIRAAVSVRADRARRFGRTFNGAAQQATLWPRRCCCSSSPRWRARAGLCRPVAALSAVARSGARDCCARDRGARGPAVLHRRVLCDRGAGRVVGDAPDARVCSAHGVAIYATFGVVALGVPIVARRLGRPLEPAWGGGVVLLASLCSCCSSARRRSPPAALWALALLLAILNAGLFVESAGATSAGRCRQFGSVLSWVMLAIVVGRARPARSACFRR